MRTIHTLVLVAGAALGAACMHHMRVDDAIAELQDPSPEQRQIAADSLRTKEGVPANAVGPLLAREQQETDAHAKAAMLITLGKSGSPNAKAPIDDYVQKAQSEEERRWAGRALKYWLIETGALPHGYIFPKGWPYGQPGYPP